MVVGQIINCCTVDEVIRKAFELKTQGIITEFVEKGLVITMDADRYLVKFTQNSKNNPCTGLLKSIRLGQSKNVPEFCKKAQSRVLDIYEEVIKREKAAGK